MLKKITIAKDKYVEIMQNYYPSLIKNVEDKELFKLKYQRGYPNKSFIYFNENTAVMPADVLLKFGVKVMHKFQAYNYQYIVECGSDNNIEPVKTDYTGAQAFHILKSKILKYISETEFWARLESFKAKKEDRPIMIHQQVKAPFIDVVVCYQNVSSIDINSAYGYLIMRDVFPEAKSTFEYLYAHRKSKPQYKQLFTHFHGFAKSLGYEGFYWHIVQECRAIIDNAIKACGGKLIYANTDGVKIQNAAITNVNIDSKLGAFKLEHINADCYVYYGPNYSILQIEDEKKGNALKEVREYIDLSKGEVVKYDKVKLFKDAKNSPMIATNIEKYKVGVIYE